MCRSCQPNPTNHGAESSSDQSLALLPASTTLKKEYLAKLARVRAKAHVQELSSPHVPAIGVVAGGRAGNAVDWVRSPGTGQLRVHLGV
jgi:hypothetical protein